MSGFEIGFITINWLTIFGFILIIGVIQKNFTVYKSNVTSKWQVTKGEVISITINNNEDGYYPTVVYKYKMPSGITHITSRYFLSDLSFIDVSAANNYLNGLREGQKITVLFDPKDPYESIVDIGSEKIAIFDLSLLFIGLFLMLYSSL